MEEDIGKQWGGDCTKGEKHFRQIILIISCFFSLPWSGVWGLLGGGQWFREKLPEKGSEEQRRHETDRPEHNDSTSF